MKDALKGMDLTERIDWACGRLILSIGSGEFRKEITLIVQVLEQNAVARHNENLKKSGARP